jgi:hypothetical protein
MNLTDLRDALDDLAGPAPQPTDAPRAAVARRVRRSRLTRATGAVALALVAVVGVGLVAEPWRGDDEPTHVVTSFGTTIHDEELGYTVTIPPGWVREPTHVGNGSTYPSILRLHKDLTAGVLGADCAGAGTQRGVAIGVQELNDIRPRQSDFPTLRRAPVAGPDADGGLRASTYPPLCGQLQQSFIFEEQGRRFAIAVLMAPDTTPAQKAETYAILNSLTFDRGTFVEKVPSPGGPTTTVTGAP